MPKLKLFLARDETGSLNLFYSRPKKMKIEGSKKRQWLTPFYNSLPVSAKLFPEITFANSPVEVMALILNKVENSENADV